MSGDGVPAGEEQPAQVPDPAAGRTRPPDRTRRVPRPGHPVAAGSRRARSAPGPCGRGRRLATRPRRPPPPRRRAPSRRGRRAPRPGASGSPPGTPRSRAPGRAVRSSRSTRWPAGSRSVQAGAQRPAVDHALGEGPEVAGRRARHRLVEERATVVEPPLVHEAEALEDEAERLDVRVTGPPADVERRPRMLQAGVELTGTRARRAPSATASARARARRTPRPSPRRPPAAARPTPSSRRPRRTGA